MTSGLRGSVVAIARALLVAMGKHPFPSNASNRRKNTHLSRTSSTHSDSNLQSASTGQATHFKWLQSRAANAALLDIWQSRPTLSLHAILEIQEHLRDFQTRIQVSEKTQRSGTSLNQVRKAMGGKYKSARLTDWQGRFKSKQKAWFMLGLENGVIPEHTAQIHIRTALASYLQGQLQRHGVSGFSTKTLDKLIFREYVKLLNKQPWEPICKTNQLLMQPKRGASRSMAFETRHTPAAKLDLILARSYLKDSLRGICSYSTEESRHAVNLWKTEFKPQTKVKTALGASNANSLEFVGLRHGVHDAYNINDEPRHGIDRDAANDNRVAEFVHAALLAHLEKTGMQIAPTDSRPEVELEVVSVNLLTPAGKELKMIRRQNDAFQRAEQRGVPVQVSGQYGETIDILVKPKFITFNTPVNSLSFGQTGKLLGINQRADEMNSNALKTLIGSTKPGESIEGVAGMHLKRLQNALRASHDMEQWKNTKIAISALQNMVEQVREIWSKRLHHDIGNEPYKLPVRLLAIANACGSVPAFNCKSGKDRTGQLNVEIRDFYAHMTMYGGEIRRINDKRTGAAKLNYQTLFEGSGDREIQALNTGVAGSKAQLNYYNTMMDAQKGTINNIKGLSRWVGS